MAFRLKVNIIYLLIFLTVYNEEYRKGNEAEF